jgi:hypothetical protein
MTEFSKEVRVTVPRGIMLRVDGCGPTAMGGAVTVKTWGDSPQEAADLIVDLGVSLASAASPAVAETIAAAPSPEPEPEPGLPRRTPVPVVTGARAAKT